jgi:hypothetical protein
MWTWSYHYFKIHAIGSKIKIYNSIIPKYLHRFINFKIKNLENNNRKTRSLQ